MTRKALFDAIKDARRGTPFTPAEVTTLDAMLDSLGIPREDVEQGEGRTVNAAGIALMHEFEGCRLTAYPDPGSKDGNPWTIGWGSTGPGIARGTVWTQAQADARFVDDLAKFASGVAAVLGAAPTTDNQFAALTSFAYNLGLQALKESTLLRMHKEGAYTSAYGQFARWVKNDGVVMRGLVRRRTAEAALYKS